MKKALSVALVVLAAWFTPLGVDDASAGPPGEIAIEATRQGPTGTFASTGAVTDDGTLQVHGAIAGGPGPGKFLNVHATEVFTGTAGTFTMIRNLRVTWGDDPNVRAIDGTWVVTGGTGAYEDLHAHGQISGTVQGFAPAETFDLTYTGVADDG